MTKDHALMWPPPPADTTHLFLIRHGATEANEQRPYVLQGRGIDLPLSNTGREQAWAVAAFLSKQTLDAVYCSSLQRSAETANVIASMHELPVRMVENVHEVHVGDWEGKSWNVILQENAPAYQAFMDNPWETPYLNGESYRDVLNRVKPVFQTLLERHRGEAIAVVAHNVVNRAYLADLMGIELRRAKELHQANCCVNFIRFRDNQTELLTLNSHFHVSAPE